MSQVNKAKQTLLAQAHLVQGPFIIALLSGMALSALEAVAEWIIDAVRKRGGHIKKHKSKKKKKKNKRRRVRALRGAPLRGGLHTAGDGRGVTSGVVVPAERIITASDQGCRIVCTTNVHTMNRLLGDYGIVLFPMTPLADPRGDSHRMYTYARMFCEYKLNSFRIRYVKSCVPDTAGLITLSHLSPSDRIGAGVSGAKSALIAKAGAVTGSVNESWTADIPVDGKWRALGPFEDGDNIQATAVVVDWEAAAVGATVLGEIFVEMDVEMREPRTTSVGLGYSYVESASMTITNSVTTGTNRAVGTIAYLTNSFDAVDLGDVGLTALARLVCVDLSGTNNTWEPLDIKHRSTDALTYASALGFALYVPSSIYF